jgi:predicted GH43/DUF377 family glycosyl hydrolase
MNVFIKAIQNLISVWNPAAYLVKQRCRKLVRTYVSIRARLDVKAHAQKSHFRARAERTSL